MSQTCIQTSLQIPELHIMSGTHYITFQLTDAFIQSEIPYLPCTLCFAKHPTFTVNLHHENH